MARVVGLDYGLRKMGFAVSDPDEIVATPVSVERYEHPKEALRLVCETCTRLEAEKLVIGLPLNMNGTESALSEAARKFGARLSGRLNFPILFWMNG
jgi:putative Holliday junction resolvase